MTGDKGCKSNHVAHAQAACKLLKREAKKMKKIFNRVLAAAVAVPVAISQGLLFTNADEAASSTKLTTADFLTIEGCKTSSDWGVDVETAIVAAAGATGTIDFSAISAALPNQDNYYVGVLNNILADSGNATATVTADSKLTVTGSFDASSWVSDKLIPAVKDKLKEMGHDASDITVTLDAANLSGTYSASIDANDISTTKTFTNGEATIVTSDGTSYKYTDYAAYLQTVVDQLKASIAQQLAANDITLTAEEAAELDDLLTVRADNWTNKIENLLGKEGEKKYDSINDLLAAANKKNSHVPASLSEAAAYNAAADAAMSQINGIINQTDVAIDITAQDVIDVLSQGYNVVATADAEIAAAGSDMKYEVGTMIEIPRAALTAGDIAKEAEFFCFGTNDLTQMTYGFSRDDAGKFLNAYYDAKIFESDPFAKLDQTGVGQLMEMAVKNGKATRPSLHCGICGEHGGDPSSVEFCHKIGLDYVSCSPFRVPIARLAAAQAAIAEMD